MNSDASSVNIKLSALPKTWIFDIDGTLVLHNGYLSPQGDTLIDGVKDFFSRISKQDKIILLTARKKDCQEDLENFLNINEIRHDLILYDMPVGERILVNDKKPSGLFTAYAINKERDEPLDLHIVIDNSL